MDEITTTHAWDRLPQETDAAWAAFREYMAMPIHHPDPKQRRSLNNLKEKLGHASITTVAGWSSRYQWVERVRAMEMSRGNQLDELKLATLQEMQTAVIQTTSRQLAVLNDIIDRFLVDVKSSQEAGIQPTAKELDSIIRAVKSKDDIMRRVAHLPTEYRYENVKDDSKDREEEAVYVLGGFDAED